jgi:hypothetical protein
VCKDDRDRLYALKSLLPENSDLVIMPDYEKKVVEVFTDLALQQLQHGQIEILYQAGLGRNLASAFHGVLPYTFPISEPVPSWVPDYRKGISYVGWTPCFGDDSSFLPDTTTAPACTPSVDNPRRLITQSTFLDVVNAVLPLKFVHNDALRADHPKIFFMIREVLKKLYESFMNKHASRPYPTGEDPTAVFVHAIVGGGTSEEYKKTFAYGVKDEVAIPLQVWQEYQEQCLSEDGQLYQEMRREIGSTAPAKRVNGIRKEWYQNSTHSGKAWDLTHYLKVVFRHHVFFSTKKGYIGLAPVGTKKDTDVVAFIDGLKVPFVLRDVEGSDWNLVGPCYMHGMMDAQAARTNEGLGTRLIFYLI